MGAQRNGSCLSCCEVGLPSEKTPRSSFAEDILRPARYRESASPLHCSLSSSCLKSCLTTRLLNPGLRKACFAYLTIRDSQVFTRIQEIKVVGGGRGAGGCCYFTPSLAATAG